MFGSIGRQFTNQKFRQTDATAKPDAAKTQKLGSTTSKPAPEIGAEAKSGPGAALQQPAATYTQAKANPFSIWHGNLRAVRSATPMGVVAQGGMEATRQGELQQAASPRADADGSGLLGGVKLKQELIRAAGGSAKVRADAVIKAAKELGDHPSLARQIARLIGSLADNPAELERALNGLGSTYQDRKEVLSKIAKAGIEVYDTGGDYPTVTDLNTDARPLAKMLHAVSKIGNSELKAAAFEAGAAALGTIPDNASLHKARQQVRDGLTSIIRSDVNGVVGTLEHQDRSGTAIVPYLKTMLKAGQTDAVGDMVARLQLGNELNGNAADRFAATQTGTDGEPFHKNAQNLGYFFGGIHAATKAVTGDIDKQAAVYQNTLLAALGVISTVVPPATIPSIGLGLSSTEAIEGVAERLKSKKITFEDAMRQAAYPPGYDGAAEAAYDGAVSRFHD